jgi:starvation-inducible DNA-binding protein
MATITPNPTKGRSTSPSEPRLFPTRNDLPEDARRTISTELNLHLAELIDLQTQVKHAHWNLKGANFIGFHKLLDEFADRLGEEIDDVAERISALGGLALGGLKDVARRSRLPEFPMDAIAIPDVQVALADRYAQVARTVRAAIDTMDHHGDKDTADLLTGTSRMLDKDLWFIEAHLQSES